MKTTNLTLITEQDGLKVTIYDSLDRNVSEEYMTKSKTKNLINGIYTIRAELSGQFVDTLALLKGKSLEITLTVPQYSPTPLTGIRTSHDYYRVAAQELSNTFTTKNRISESKSARLFIFLRCSSREHFYDFRKKNPNYLDEVIKSLFLVDEIGKSQVKNTDWIKDELTGYIALSVPLKPGLYYFLQCPSVESKKCRQMALYIFKNWQTRIFITLASEPLFNGMRIQMTSVKQIRDINDDINYSIDLLSSRLENHTYEIPEYITNKILRQNTPNPVLSVLWAYSYLLSNSLIDFTLIENLLSKLPKEIRRKAKWADLETILSLKALYTKDYAVEKQISKPPMFSIGLQQLVKLTSKFHDVIPEISIINDILPNVSSNSLITNWTPDQTVVDSLLTAETRKHKKRSEELRGLVFDIRTKLRSPTNQSIFSSSSFNPSVNILPGRKNSPPKLELPWTVIQIISEIDRLPNITLTDLVNRTALSASALKLVITRLDEDSMYTLNALRIISEVKKLANETSELIKIIAGFRKKNFPKENRSQPHPTSSVPPKTNPQMKKEMRKKEF